MRLFCTLSFLTLYYCAYAQSTGLSGKVIDVDTRLPLIGASIVVGETGKVSEVDGSFEFQLAPGMYDLKISYVGYEAISQIIEIQAEDILKVSYELSVTQSLLETATITGSKYQKSLATAPVSISLVDSKLLSETNTTNISELVDKVPGVQIIDGQANIRGGSGFSYGAGSRVMLLIDGMPALQADAGRPNWTDIPVENISQIEIIKGASSVLYGSAAMNGIIHVRSAYATSKPVAKFSASYLQYDSPPDPKKQWWEKAPRNLAFTGLYKRKIGKLDLVTHGFYHDESKFYQSDNGTFDKTDDIPMFSKNGRFGAGLNYRISDRFTIGLNTNFTKIDMSNSLLWRNPVAGAYVNFPGAITSGQNTRFYIDPHLNYYDKADNKHKLQSRYYYIDNQQNNGQSNSSQSFFTEYQFQKKMEAQQLLFTGGLVALVNNTDAELFGDTLFSSRNLAVYSQLEKQFFKKLDLIFGFRFENNLQRSPEEFLGFQIPGGRDIDSKFILRSALNLQISKASFLRASLGQGYRYPTITEKFINTSFGGINIFANPFLEPETGYSSELGFKQGIAFGPLKGYIDIAGFWSQYENMMEFNFVEVQGDFGFQAENVGQIDIKGFETNIVTGRTWGDFNLSVLTGYTYINPVYRNFDGNIDLQESLSSRIELIDGSITEVVPENILKYRSKHNFKLNVDGTWKKIHLGASFAQVSKVPNIDAILANFANIRAYRSLNNSGYKTLDLRLSYEIHLAKATKTKISLIGKNVLNEEYTLRPGQLQAPRNFALRIDLEF